MKSAPYSQIVWEGKKYLFEENGGWKGTIWHKYGKKLIGFSRQRVYSCALYSYIQLFCRFENFLNKMFEKKQADG